MCQFIEAHAVTMDHDGFHKAVDELQSMVREQSDERELQAFLEYSPYVLSQQFSHCNHVFPQVSLGREYVADFFCLDIPSYGREWWGVELESPKKPIVTKSGRKSAVLENALQQVRDWRRWISRNLDYAQRPREQSGLGLGRIQPDFWGYVVIGRRMEFSRPMDDIRRQVLRDERIQIRTWDGIVEWARKRANVLAGTNGPCD